MQNNDWDLHEFYQNNVILKLFAQAHEELFIEFIEEYLEGLELDDLERGRDIEELQEDE